MTILRKTAQAEHEARLAGDSVDYLIVVSQRLTISRRLTTRRLREQPAAFDRTKVHFFGILRYAGRKKSDFPERLSLKTAPRSDLSGRSPNGFRIRNISRSARSANQPENGIPAVHKRDRNRDCYQDAFFTPGISPCDAISRN